MKREGCVVHARRLFATFTRPPLETQLDDWQEFYLEYVDSLVEQKFCSVSNSPFAGIRLTVVDQKLSVDLQRDNHQQNLSRHIPCW
jgi:hypothetical protein